MNIVRPTNEYNYYSVNYSIREYPKCPIAVFNGTRLDRIVASLFSIF